MTYPPYEIQKHIEYAIDVLINSIRATKYIQSSRDTLDPISFKKEYCTMRFGLPRRSGKTQVVLNMLEKYESSVLFVEGVTKVTWTLERAADRRLDRYSGDIKNRVFNINTLNNIRGHSITQRNGVSILDNDWANIVLVDDFSFIKQSEEKLDYLYRIMHRSEFFILFG